MITTDCHAADAVTSDDFDMNRQQRADSKSLCDSFLLVLVLELHAY